MGSNWLKLKDQIEGRDGITIIQKPMDSIKQGGKMSPNPHTYGTSEQQAMPSHNGSYECIVCASDDTTSDDFSSEDDLDSLYLGTAEVSYLLPMLVYPNL